jgi:hypothetical protein
VDGCGPKANSPYTLPLIFIAKGQEFFQGSFGPSDEPARGLRLFQAQFERSTVPNAKLFRGYLGPLVGVAIGPVGFVTDTATVHPANGYEDSVYGVFQVDGERVCLFRIGATSSDGVAINNEAGSAGTNNSAVFCDGTVVFVGSYDGRIWRMDLSSSSPFQDAVAVPEFVPVVTDASGNTISLAAVRIVQATDGVIYAGFSSQGTGPFDPAVSVVMRRGGRSAFHQVVWSVVELVNSHLVAMCAGDSGNIFVATDGNDPMMASATLGPLGPILEIGPNGTVSASDGLPAGVRCADMEYNPADRNVYLATCGRSLWRLQR